MVDWAVLARDFWACDFWAAVLLVVDWAVLACVVLVALLLAAADDWAVLARDFGAGFLDADWGADLAAGRDGLWARAFTAGLATAGDAFGVRVLLVLLADDLRADFWAGFDGIIFLR